METFAGLEVHTYDIDCSPHWIEDCVHWHGRILTGSDGHWCYCWDELPIDDTCQEMEACTCTG